MFTQFWRLEVPIVLGGLASLLGLHMASFLCLHMAFSLHLQPWCLLCDHISCSHDSNYIGLGAHPTGLLLT